MAKYGSNVLQIDVDDSGGTPRNMSDFITEMNGLNITGLTEESHAFLDSWVENLFTGVNRADDITFGGFFDDVALGPDAVFINSTVIRTVQFTWGGTKTSSFECLISSYKRQGVRGELTKFEVVLKPSGTVTEV